MDVDILVAKKQSTNASRQGQGPYEQFVRSPNGFARCQVSILDEGSRWFDVVRSILNYSIHFDHLHASDLVLIALTDQIP